MVGLTKEKRDYLNKVVPISQLGELLGKSWERRKSIFCPFHENTRTMAAKVFPDTNTIFCYAEQKVFRPVDVMVKLLGWSLVQMMDYAKKFDCCVIPDSLDKKEPDVFDTEGMTLTQIILECDRRFKCE